MLYGHGLRRSPAFIRVGRRLPIANAVMESWRGILANPDSPRIACYDERVFLYGDTALVVCEEELDGGTLVASNWFVREDGLWRMAHHQAGQLVARRPAGPPPAPSRMN
jgi:hypothetical protein